VVEAGEESGALLTAEFAVEQGIEVWAVPGPVHGRASVGTNRLIARGARVALSPDEVIASLPAAGPGQVVPAGPDLVEDPIDRQILQVVEQGPTHVDEVQNRCHLSASQVAVSLAMLELRGYVQQVGGMQYVRVRELARPYSAE
jgi:DNA processing protein